MEFKNDLVSFFLHVAVHFSQHHSLQRLSFQHCVDLGGGEFYIFLLHALISFKPDSSDFPYLESCSENPNLAIFLLALEEISANFPLCCSFQIIVHPLILWAFNICPLSLFSSFIITYISFFLVDSAQNVLGIFTLWTGIMYQFWENLSHCLLNIVLTSSLSSLLQDFNQIDTYIVFFLRTESLSLLSEDNSKC